MYLYILDRTNNSLILEKIDKLEDNKHIIDYIVNKHGSGFEFDFMVSDTLSITKINMD